jgi:MGT family glycosyltransferase
VLTTWGAEPGTRAFLDTFRFGQDACRAQFGLAPWDGRSTADRWLAFTPPSWARLDGAPDPQTMRTRLEHGQPSTDAWRGDGPLVYATLGTIYGTTRKLLRSFIQALETGGWRSLVTVGRNNAGQVFEHGPRVQVQAFVPQDDVLPHAAAVLCHAGFGTVMGALARGIPMVVVPLGVDQMGNAERIDALGAGIVVAPADATPDRLRDALAAVMADPRYRGACRRLQAEIDALPPMGAAAIRLAGLRDAAPLASRA